MPRRSPRRTINRTPTPNRRRNCTHASPMSLAGSIVTNSTGTPKWARETATLDSPPPYTTSKVVACAKRRWSGGESLIMISPKVTTFSPVSFIPFPSTLLRRADEFDENLEGREHYGAFALQDPRGVSTSAPGDPCRGGAVPCRDHGELGKDRGGRRSSQ